MIKIGENDILDISGANGYGWGFLEVLISPLLIWKMLIKMM